MTHNIDRLESSPKQHGLRCSSKLITLLRNNLQPTPAPQSTPRPHPRHSTRPPPLPSPTLQHPQSGRPKPASTTTFEPYQLKPKRGKIKPHVEVSPPPSKPKQIKCMKKKLGNLNKKIRHSKKNHNNLVSKQNSIKKKIEELKESSE